MIKILFLITSWVLIFLGVGYIQSKFQAQIKNKFFLELINFFTGISGFALLIFLVINLYGERHQPRFDAINKPYQHAISEYDFDEMTKCYGGNVCE